MRRPENVRSSIDAIPEPAESVFVRLAVSGEGTWTWKGFRAPNRRFSPIGLIVF
jgi:hypothetical protein